MGEGWGEIWKKEDLVQKTEMKTGDRSHWKSREEKFFVHQWADDDDDDKEF